MGIRIFEVNPLSTLPKHFLPSILFGSVLLLILFLVWIKTSDVNAVLDVLKSLRRYIVALIVLQVFLLWKYVSEYQEIYLGYQNGNYSEVEGNVEHYSISPRDYVEFEVNGIQFDYGNDGRMGSPTSAVSRMIEDGQHVKIGYITINTGENEIVYIERLPS